MDTFRIKIQTIDNTTVYFSQFKFIGMWFNCKEFWYNRHFETWEGGIIAYLNYKDAEDCIKHNKQLNVFERLYFPHS